ncbi:MAG: glycine cleavage system protein GcvH [Bacteroidetes bacterium]|jgi:glycine cleavage system H protein|nr:glycine cleavage system protein GcvH [Bacteroidota bacterium]
MNIPDHLRYTADHEWVALEGDSALVGITDYAQGELGDIVFVEIETVGQALRQGDVFGTVEAVKTVSDLFMPVSGTLLEKNAGLDSAPESVNSDAYGSGWMVRIQLDDPAQVDALMSPDEYRKHIGL